MKPELIIACYGAIVATLVLIWDIIKYFKGNLRLFVSVSPNMITLNIPSRDGRTWIIVTVSNRGSQPVTIHTLGCLLYSNPIRRLFNRPNLAFIVPAAFLPTYDTPYLLQPGAEWKGSILQDEEFMKKYRKYIITAVIQNSATKKPIQVRITNAK